MANAAAAMPLEAEGGGRAKTRRDREKHLNEQHLKKRNRVGVDFNAFLSSPLLTVDDLRCWNKSAIILLFTLWTLLTNPH